MRTLGLIGLVLALLVVGLLVKKQMGATVANVPGAATSAAPAGDARAQSQQIQQQVRQSLDEAMRKQQEQRSAADGN